MTVRSVGKPLLCAHASINIHAHTLGRSLMIVRNVRRPLLAFIN
ncbi:Zinc finger protein 26 [Apodemus speciosus]|uniref:Zinc finger protein 26 n=1 Tax=Apodemus speciosus TaxID=105296 RepID=A0ABQ0F3W0_APOSI